MATHQFIPVLGKRYRVTTLSPSGLITEDSEQIVGDGFVTVTLSSEVEDGVEITSRKFTGAMCVNETGSPSFKNFSLEIEFCGVNPDALTSMTNAEPYVDAAGDTAGFTVPEGDLDKAFALEIWMGLSGAAVEEGQDEASAYLLLPYVRAGVLGDIELGGEDAVTFSMTSAATRGGNSWGVGPYDVVYTGTAPDLTPGPLPEALDPMDHLLIMDTGLATPAITDELQPVPSGGAAAGE